VIYPIEEDAIRKMDGIVEAGGGQGGGGGGEGNGHAQFVIPYRLPRKVIINNKKGMKKEKKCYTVVISTRFVPAELEGQLYAEIFQQKQRNVGGIRQVWATREDGLCVRIGEDEIEHT